MTYSTMLKEILRSSHWTQEQLAAKLGVSFATVNSWIHGKTKPQRSLTPAIEKLYLAQDVTNEPEPIYVTLANAEGIKVGDYVKLTKNLDDEFDDEAVRAEVIDLLTGKVKEEIKPAQVANSVDIVMRGTRSAGRIYDKFDVAAKAQVEFTKNGFVVARVVSWNCN